MKENSADKNPLVAVLLATHNPTNLIAHQIESIKHQVDVTTRIYWGDYGSPETIKQYVRKLLQGTDFIEYTINKSGPAENFLYLLNQSNEDYIAFSDQDDIWLPKKLRNQVNSLEGNKSIPSLVHSNSDLLIGAKHVIRKSQCKNHDFATLAVSNCCQGCTVMINSAAREIVLSSLPDGIIWHDWWIGLVISLTGQIFSSTETEVVYRIHAHNTIGLPNFSKRVRNFVNRPSGLISYQINEAINRFGYFKKNESNEFTMLRDLTSANIKTRFVSFFRYSVTQKITIRNFFRRLAWVLKQP